MELYIRPRSLYIRSCKATHTSAQAYAYVREIMYS